MNHRISKKKTIALSVATLVILAGISGYVVGYDRIARKIGSIGQSVTIDRSQGAAGYPTIETANLTVTQKRIIVLTKQEFEAQSLGTKFSEGQNESWCADFVSWIMKGAGMSLSNPNSGSWRIPGIYTLYRHKGTFRAADSGYTPKLGDVAIYQNSPVFGDHTNIVLASDNGVLTTVGGNENGRIRVYENTQKQYDGLIGYGVLE